MGKDTRSRKWLLTINNPSDKGLSHEAIKVVLGGMESIEYWCMCDEIGKDGTHHTHVFLKGRNAYFFSAMKKRFPTAHIDQSKATCKQGRDYVRKEGKWENSEKKETNLPETFEESGDCPEESPGRRTDLEELYGWIKEGLTDREIIDLNPRYLFDVDRISRARQLVLEGQYKDTFRSMHVEYWWGHTGTGKTRGVMEKYGYSKVFRVTDYDHPFDSYRQQSIVIFEEFRSSLKIQDMLNYLDGYPLELPCRYHNKIACYTQVYLISNIPLESQYETVQREHPGTWEAFKRRIHKNRHFGLELVRGDCPF